MVARQGGRPAVRQGERHHPQLLRGRRRAHRGRRRPAAGDAARRWPGRLGVVELRLGAAAVRRDVPHPAGRPARLRRLRQAARGRQLLPALRRLRRQPARRARHRAGPPARQQPRRRDGDPAHPRAPRPGRPAGPDGPRAASRSTCSTPTRPRASSGSPSST